MLLSRYSKIEREFINSCKKGDMITLLKTIQSVRKNRDVMDKGFIKAAKNNQINVIKFIYELRDCNKMEYDISFFSYVFACEYARDNNINEITEYLQDRIRIGW